MSLHAVVPIDDAIAFFPGCTDNAVLAPASEPLRRREVSRERSFEQGLPASTICANLHEKARADMSLEQRGRNPRNHTTVAAILHKALRSWNTRSVPANRILKEVLCSDGQVLHRLERNETAYAGFKGVDVPGMSRSVLLHLRCYQVRGGEHPR